MKVKVLIKQTEKGLQAWAIQEGRQGGPLIDRRTTSVDLAKTRAFTSLPKGVTDVEWELEGVEE